MGRTNPNIVEETETGYIERLPKSEYAKVDDRHIRNLIVGGKPIEFFKEDENYYYISVSRMLPEEKKVLQKGPEQSKGNRTVDSPPPPTDVESKVSLSDFQDLVPARVEASFRLEQVENAGLPAAGMWRASFAVADVNQDGIPDIVSPPPRIGDGNLRVWIGDGKGRFIEWPLSFTEGGNKVARFSIDYGGVAVGDIDGDGHLDIVSASHGGGLVSLFGDGKGGFEVLRTGLPKKEFSTQAVTLVDADGDGKLDIVASRDVPDQDQPEDLIQVRLYVFLGRDKGWEFRKSAIVGAPFSNSVASWDYDGDGRPDLLMGSHWVGSVKLLWKGQAGGTFSQVPIPELELYAYHFATAPGTYGKTRAAAFAESFLAQTNVPETARVAGISLYSFRDGEWTRHRLWRQKEPKSSVYGLAMGDLDGDGLDDVVFLDNEKRRVRVLMQQPDGSFSEIAEKDEPILDSPGQCVRLTDLDKDGRLDLVISKTVTSANPTERGGWSVYLNKVK